MRLESQGMLMESETLDPLFVRHGVSFAYLFGSRARKRELATSDIDVACWYKEDDCMQRFLQNCELQADLAKLFSVPLDLIILNDSNPVLQGEAVLKGQLLYPRPGLAVVRFEARIRQRCEDYAYSQRFFSRALSQRLAAG